MMITATAVTQNAPRFRATTNPTTDNGAASFVLGPRFHPNGALRRRFRVSGTFPPQGRESAPGSSLRPKLGMLATFCRAQTAADLCPCRPRRHDLWGTHALINRRA